MKFVNSVFLVLISIGLMSCGHPDAWWVNPNSTSTVTVTDTGTTLQTILTQEDAYLESIGQHDLVPGLSCTLYTVPTNTTSIANASCTEVNYGSWDYLGTFNQPLASVTTGFNVLPTALQGIYQTWFIVRCSGYLASLDNNYHQFTLTSDDGSMLYVDYLLINNDGLHSSQAVSNTRQMSVGMHYFELDFLQGAGMQTLVLNEDSQIMSGNLFYH